MPPFPEMNDQEILAALRAGGQERERAWEFMYKQWRGIWMKQILDAGGSTEEAESANSDVYIPFIKRITQPDFAPQSATLKTYYTRCVYYRWMKTARKEAVIEGDDQLVRSVVESVEEQMTRKELNNWMDKVLGVLNERCRKTLQMWSMGYKMEEIAQALSIPGGAGKAKQARYDCMMKLIKWLDEHPKVKLTLQDFLKDETQ